MIRQYIPTVYLDLIFVVFMTATRKGEKHRRQQNQTGIFHKK